MRSTSKSPKKISSISLAKAAQQFLTKIEFDYQPLLKDKIYAETIQKVGLSLDKFEIILKSIDKIDAAELMKEFHKTDKALDKVTTKFNAYLESLKKVDKHFEEKITSKLPLLRRSEPKDATDSGHRVKIEENTIAIKLMIETIKKKMDELNAPLQLALKRMHTIAPKILAIGLTEELEHCQKHVEKLSEEIESICKTTAEMGLTDAASSIKEPPKVKAFIPKLKAEIERSGKLLDQAGINLGKIFPETTLKEAAKETAESKKESPSA